MCGCEAITCEGCPCGCGHTKDTRISALMREVDDIKVHSPKEEPVVDSLEEIDWQKGFIKRIIALVNTVSTMANNRVFVM
jgi:hypothetical protein